MDVGEGGDVGEGMVDVGEGMVDVGEGVMWRKGWWMWGRDGGCGGGG